MKCWVTSFPLTENVNLSYLRVCSKGRQVGAYFRDGRKERREATLRRSRRQRPAAAEPRAMWGWFREGCGVWPGSEDASEAFSRVVLAPIVWHPGFGGFTRFYRIDAVVPRSLMHRRCQMPLAQPWSFSEKLL